jgi:hypothetical protein
MQCLEKDLDKRPQSASELAALLAPFSVSKPTISPRAPIANPGAVVVPVAATPTPASASRYGITTLSGSTSEMVTMDVRGGSSRKRLALGAGIVIAIAAAVVVLTTSADNSKSKPAAAATPATEKAAVEKAIVEGPTPILAPVAKKMAMLKISTDPPGAEIFINEESIGESPIAIQREMGGTLSLRIVSKGYATVDADVTIEALVQQASYSLKRDKRKAKRRR